MSIQLWVSSNGNDGWDGTESRPFATLEKARDTIRQLRHKGEATDQPIEVTIVGTIELHQPLLLDELDSGTQSSPVIYKGADGSSICGGVRITNFEPVANRDVLAAMDEKARDNVVQADLKVLGITDFGPPIEGGVELFFNDVPMTLSRWPNEGFTKIVGLVDNKPFKQVHWGIPGDYVGDIIYDGDRPSRWLKETDPWVHGYWFWDWSDQKHRIAEIDVDRSVIKVAPPYHTYGYRPGQYFYAFNLLSEIDTPGEWYLDRENGLLYLWPPDDIESSKVVVSVVDKAIVAKSVSHVHLDNLLIENTRGGAIDISDSDDVTISDCLVRNVGGYGINVQGGSRCIIRGCELHGIGQYGITITGGDRVTLAAANHQVLECHIHGYGRITRMYSPAIGINGVGNRIANCLIHDAPHVAILFSGNEHIIEYSEIHHVCQESNDAGAIYAGRDWSMRGTQIRHNYLHDIVGFENKGCMGVYLDDFYCGTAIYGNVFKNVSSAAFVGGGRDNRIHSNLFTDCNPCIHLDARGENWAKEYFREGHTELLDKLNAVNYKSDYYARYPGLASVFDGSNLGHPTGNRFNSNVGIGGVWEDIEDGAAPGNEFNDNTVTNDYSLLITDPETDVPGLTAAAYEATGLKPIPTDRIGLGKVADQGV